MKYKEWLQDWLENYVKPISKSKTYTHYQQNVNLHIIPFLGEYEVENITPLVAQRFVTEMLKSGNLRTGKGLSATTVNSLISTIQQSMETAYHLGITNRFEMNKLKRPKISGDKVMCFTLQEQKKLEHAAMSDKREKMKGVVVCLYTGLRVGELLALEWTDIDFKSRELSINKTVHDSKDTTGKIVRQINSPKTATSTRIIPLPKPILEVLKKMKHSSKSKFVIESDGKPVSVRSYQKSFELLLKKEKIPHRGFHSLRHTFATRALECGVDVKTLSEVLGHKSPTITLNRYAHSMPEHKRDMMKKIGKLL